MTIKANTTLIAELLAENAALKAERDQLRKSHKALHRRCQDAETALPDYQKLIAIPPDGDGVRLAGGNFGRALLTYLASKQGENITRLSAERDRLRELVCEVAMSGREFDDPRVPYVTAQIDRAIWHGLRAALDGHDATEP